jgi:hypothetical protein
VLARRKSGAKQRLDISELPFKQYLQTIKHCDPPGNIKPALIHFAELFENSQAIKPTPLCAAATAFEHLKSSLRIDFADK